MTWNRSGKTLPRLQADDQMIELIEAAQEGDEVAVAGLVLILSDSITSAVKGHAWYLEHDPFGIDGKAAAMSMLWLAIGAFDTKRHTIKVGNRLIADVQYLARKPTRRGDAKHSLTVPTTNDSYAYSFTKSGHIVAHQNVLGTLLSENAEHDFGDVEYELWLEQACDNAELSELHREVAKELLLSDQTDRELASTLNIPVGSIARHRRTIREALADQLVA